MTIISSQLLSHFGADLVGSLWSVPELAGATEHPLHAEMVRALEELPDPLIAGKLTDQPFLAHYGHLAPVEVQRWARLEAFRSVLDKQLAELLLAHLRSDDARPLPYSLGDLGGVDVGADHLIPSNTLGETRGTFLSATHEYYLCRSLPATNCMAWVQNVLFRVLDAERVTIRVRLDPLLRQSLPGQSAPEYKMWVYGTTLSWDQIRELKEQAHGRWMPHPLTTGGVAFTDYAWSPRGAEVHFTCEELPGEDLLGTRGSRYLHAIYSPETHTFSHLDGAIRIYDRDEYEQRVATHLRSSGKIGKRVKLFQVDGQLMEEEWSALSNAFFVWNQDVWNYLAPSDQDRIPAI